MDPRTTGASYLEDRTGGISSKSDPREPLKRRDANRGRKRRRSFLRKMPAFSGILLIASLRREMTSSLFFLYDSLAFSSSNSELKCERILSSGQQTFGGWTILRQESELC